MNYGPHTSAVEDVLEFLDQRNLLRGCDPLDDESVKIITSLEDVEKYQDISEEIDPDFEALVWIDIKRRAGTDDPGIVLRVIDAIDPIVLERLRELWRSRVHPAVTQQLVGRIDSHHAEVITNDFEMIINFRAAFGRNTRLIERLYRLYQLGGYPCGWDGLYPDGRLVCYCASASDPTFKCDDVAG